ncbi:MAG: DNA repair protein RecO [Desulfatiglandaceae bacterium]|jgi:DNA repair protein RecO (recombination protein O)
MECPTGYHVMNAQVSPSIILRTREVGESDLIVTFFTAEKGRLKGIAKGARRSRKRFVNCLDLFSLSSLEYSIKPGYDFYFLHSGKLLENFPSLRSDYTLVSLAGYLVELTEMLFPVNVPDANMFKLLSKVFNALHEGVNGAVIRALFEARAMTLGGFRIQLDKCCRCGRPYHGEGRAAFQCARGGIACLKCERETAGSPGLGPISVNFLEGLQSGWWPENESFDLGANVLQELQPVLKQHIAYRIEKRLKTLAYLS